MSNQFDSQSRLGGSEKAPCLINLVCRYPLTLLLDHSILVAQPSTASFKVAFLMVTAMLFSGASPSTLIAAAQTTRDRSSKELKNATGAGRQNSNHLRVLPRGCNPPQSVTDFVTTDSLALWLLGSDMDPRGCCSLALPRTYICASLRTPCLRQCCWR